MNRRCALKLAAGIAFFPSAAMAAKGDWLEPGPAIPDVVLTDQDGNQRPLVKLIGQQPVIINFFFTGCRTVCPTQMVQLKILQQQLAELSLSASGLPLIVSIALDPLGDTPEAIKEFMSHFDIKTNEKQKWVFLTGSFESLKPVWQSFEQAAGDPSDHPGFFWIGRTNPARWSRVEASATPEDLRDLVLEQLT